MSDIEFNIETLQGSLVGRHSIEAGIRLAFPDCEIAVDTNSSNLYRKLKHYFSAFLSSATDSPDIRIYALESAEPNLGLDYTVKLPDPGKTKVKEEYVDFADGRVVRKRLTGMHFLFGGNNHIAYGPCEANDNQIVNFVNNRYIQHQLNRGYLLAHAAAVANDVHGLALAGFSGAGKSTLALQAVAQGLTFVSNDRLMIKRNERLDMLGVAKYPRVNPGTVLNNSLLGAVIPAEERVQLEKVPPEELWDLEQKYDVFLDECFGPGRFQLRAEMAGLVILNWKRERTPHSIRRVDLNQRDDLLGAFMKSVGLFFEPEDDGPGPDLSPAAYLETLQDCPVFELTGGVDFEAAAASCRRYLDTGVMPEAE